MEDVVKLPTHILFRILKEPTKPVCGGYHRDSFFGVVYDALAQTFCRGERHIVHSDKDLSLYSPTTAAANLPVL